MVLDLTFGKSTGIRWSLPLVVIPQTGIRPTAGHFRGAAAERTAYWMARLRRRESRSARRLWLRRACPTMSWAK